MALEVLRTGGASTQAAELCTGLLVRDLLIRHRLQELPNPQTSGIPGSLPGWKDMIRPDDLRKSR